MYIPIDLDLIKPTKEYEKSFFLVRSEVEKVKHWYPNSSDFYDILCDSFYGKNDLDVLWVIKENRFIGAVIYKKIRIDDSEPVKEGDLRKKDIEITKMTYFIRPSEWKNKWDLKLLEKAFAVFEQLSTMKDFHLQKFIHLYTDYTEIDLKWLYDATTLEEENENNGILIDTSKVIGIGSRNQGYMLKRGLLFTKFYKHKELALTSLGLKSIPKELFELTHLESLLLSNNTYFHFETFLKTGIITGFDIGNEGESNYIPTISPKILKLKGLKILGLSKIGLENLPTEIGELENLEIVDISGNPIDRLPKSILNLKKLEHLFIHETNLTNKLYEYQKKTKEPFPYSIRKKLEILTE